jgi:hypothetical protein
MSNIKILKTNLHVTLEHEHPVETIAVLPTGVGLVGVAIAGLHILRVNRVHGTRSEGLVRLKQISNLC